MIDVFQPGVRLPWSFVHQTDHGMQRAPDKSMTAPSGAVRLGGRRVLSRRNDRVADRNAVKRNENDFANRVRA